MVRISPGDYNAHMVVFAHFPQFFWLLLSSEMKSNCGALIKKNKKKLRVNVSPIRSQETLSLSLASSDMTCTRQKHAWRYIALSSTVSVGTKQHAWPYRFFSRCCRRVTGWSLFPRTSTVLGNLTSRLSDMRLAFTSSRRPT